MASSVTGSTVSRDCNSYSGGYKMRLKIEDTGISADKLTRKIKITLQGYASGSGGYESYSSPKAWIANSSGTALSSQATVKNWWPRDKWIDLTSYSTTAAPGNRTYRGYFNSNTTTSYLPKTGNWYASATLAVDTIPQTAPTISAITVDTSVLGEATVTATISGNYTNVEYSIDNTTWQTSNVFSVLHNTQYTFYVRSNYVISAGSSDWAVSSITATTEGVAPTITYSSDNIVRTSGSGVYPSTYQNTLSYSIGYDVNAIYGSCSFFYGTIFGTYDIPGTIVWSGSSLTCITNNNLAAKTRYYYQIVLADNFNKTTTYTGDFITDCLPPGNAAINIDSSSITTTSFGGTATAIGDTNAPITSCSIYYQSTTDPSDSGAIDYVYNGGVDNLNQAWNFTNLTIDKTYNVYCDVRNSKGTTTSSVVQVSTNLDTPVITSFTGSAVDAFTISVTLVGSSPSGHTLNYAFSSNGGTSWSTYQSGNTYTFTGLTEETTYTIGGRIKALASGGGSDTYATGYITITTPTDQAKARIKINGSWQRGKVFIKQNGAWVKAKKIYYKYNGQWVVGHDND